MDRNVQDDAAAASTDGASSRQPRTLRLRPGGEVAQSDGRGSSLSVPTGEIVFILDAHEKGEGYVIARLEEQPDGGERPHRLRLDGVDEVDEVLLERYGMREVPAFLAPGNELHVVVSTKSGMGMALKVWEDVVRPLLQLLGGSASSDEGTERYHVMITQNAQSVREFARSRWAARKQTADGARSSETIILLSGDGGVVDLLNGSDETITPLTNGNASVSPLPTIALLPLGTANALFHSLHKPLYGAHGEDNNQAPSPLVLALRTLIRGTPAPLPSFRVTFSEGSRLVSYAPTTSSTNQDDDATNGIKRHDTAVTHLYGAIVASYGFHAQLVWESDTPEYRKHGAARFGMLAASLLEESHAYRAEVRATSLDGGESVLQGGDAVPPKAASGDANFNYVLATMVSNLERTFTISPDSRPLENDLRLVHFGDVGGKRTMEIMTAAYADGAHVGMADVGYERVAGMRVKILEGDARWRKVCVDGTIVEIPQGGDMDVRRVEGALFGVLVPEGVLSPRGM